jgi:hypothetical protein
MEIKTSYIDFIKLRIKSLRENNKINGNIIFYDNIKYNGGKGSGYWKHKGRKGKVGGSVKSEGININFNKNNILPKLDNKRLSLIRQEANKQVIFKKKTIDRNREKHPDLNKDDYNKSFQKSLYDENKKIVLPPRNDKPNYYNLVGKLKRGKYSSIILDTEPLKEYFEVVHVINVDKKRLKEYIKEARKNKKK